MELTGSYRFKEYEEEMVGDYHHIVESPTAIRALCGHSESWWGEISGVANVEKHVLFFSDEPVPNICKTCEDIYAGIAKADQERLSEYLNGHQYTCLSVGRG